MDEYELYGQKESDIALIEEYREKYSQHSIFRRELRGL